MHAFKVTIYKRYFFLKGDRLAKVKQISDKNDFILLEKSDPLIALVDRKHKKTASYDHVLSVKELRNYSNRTSLRSEEFLRKAVHFGEFALSKNKGLVKKLIFILLLLVFEVLFILVSNIANPLYTILEITGTTLTFFFYSSYLEYEGHHLMLQSYDSESENEIKNINLLLSGLGIVLFLVGFFMNLDT